MKRSGQLIVLAALIVVLAAVLAYQWWQAGETSGTEAPASARPTAGASARRPQTAPASAVPAVRLDALAAARAQPQPPAAERNLFLFQPKLPPPPPAAGRAGGSGTGPGDNGAPATPPPPPPIPLKFIGIVQAPNQKLAVLTDSSTRDVFYGREGDVIDGRYRILRIGVESIEMAYLDGRGRQTIRLTGS
jgi:hypothetical protein